MRQSVLMPSERTSNGIGRMTIFYEIDARSDEPGLTHVASVTGMQGNTLQIEQPQCPHRDSIETYQEVDPLGEEGYRVVHKCIACGQEISPVLYDVPEGYDASELESLEVPQLPEEYRFDVDTYVTGSINDDR